MSDATRPGQSSMNAECRDVRSAHKLIERSIGDLLESMPDGIILADTSGKIVLVNSQAEKLFGYGQGDLISLDVEALVPDCYRERHVDLRNGYIANPEKRPMGQERKLFGLRQDGSELPVEISLSPMQTEAGLLICAAVRDVTQRIQVENALRASEEKVRSQVLEERYFDLYANSPDMCASIEAKTGRIVDCNNTLAVATGYTREELLAMPHISHLYHPDSEEARKEVFRGFVETGSVREAELRLMCKDGGAIDVSLSLTAVRDENGKITRSRSVWRDITDRKRSEKLLRLIVEGTSLSFGEDYFRSLVRHLANALEVRCAFVSELHEQREGRLRLLALWGGNDFEDIYEYEPEGTPCELVIKKGLVCYPEKVQEFFPKDQWLIESRIESYLAIPLLDPDGNPVGHLGVADDKPLPDTLAARSILQVVSTRAGAELLRMRAEKALQLANDELELRVTSRTADLEEANRQLKEDSAKRRWLTSIYRASPIGLCCLDTQLRYIDVNEWLAELNGISVEEHLGRTISEVLPDLVAGVESQLRQVIEMGEPILNGEVVGETPADPNVKKHFLHNYYPLRSNKGDIVGISCAIQDITERRNAEEALRKATEELEDRVKQRTVQLEQSNEHLRAEMASRKQAEQDLQQTHEELNRILDSVPNYIWSADIDAEGTLTYRYLSPVVEDITGRPPEVFMASMDTWMDTIHPDDRPRLQEAFGRIVARQSMREEEEYRIVLPDGTVRWVRDNMTVSLTDNGGLRLDGVVGDITERMRVEDALRESEEKIRLVLDSTFEAIYGLDLKGNCTFCNRACVETLGYHRAEELLGRNMHDLIHHTRPDGSPYPIHECKIYEAFWQGRGTHINDEVLWKADGTSFPAEYRSFPVRRDGELVGSVVTFFDITEQKDVAETLRIQRSELTHADRLRTLGEMAAGLAHELNQPLTAMSAFAEGALDLKQAYALGVFG